MSPPIIGSGIIVSAAPNLPNIPRIIRSKPVICQTQRAAIWGQKKIKLLWTMCINIVNNIVCLLIYLSYTKRAIIWTRWTQILFLWENLFIWILCNGNVYLFIWANDKAISFQMWLIEYQVHSINWSNHLLRCTCRLYFVFYILSTNMEN